MYASMMVAEAATGGSFNFSSFQQSFQEAWDFVFPNVLILLLCLLVRDKAISSGNDIYRQIDQWGDRLRHSSNLPGSENFIHWEKQAGEWSMREGDFKLLAAVALVACGAGLIRKRWFSLLR